MTETIILLVAATFLLLTSMSQFAAIGFSTSRARRAKRQIRARSLRNLRQAAEVVRLNSQLHDLSGREPSLDWRVMEVAEIVDESVDCRSFYLVDPYGQSLPSFRPGQHLMVRPAMAGAYQTTRCYSLSSSPDPRYWRITVKRQLPEEAGGLPPRNGGLSDWLHRTIHLGDCLLIGGPNGQFYLPAEHRRPLVLLAAGVGITPMASMLRWSLEQTPQRPVHLFYQVRDLDHWPLGSSLHSWQHDFPQCRIHTFMSRAGDKELARLANDLPGQFRPDKFEPADLVEAMGPLEGDYFMCGPDGWMQSMRDGLQAAGVSSERVHWESFGGTVTDNGPVPDGPVESVPVRFEHSQVDTAWSDPQQSLWELARESQVDIPSGCLSGVCGCCRVKLLSGEVEYDRQISIELADDECLTCVSRPTSPVTIDA